MKRTNTAGTYIDLIPEQVARAYRVLPVSKESGTLILATLDPPEDKVRNELAFLTGMELRVNQVELSTFNAGFEELYGTPWAEAERVNGARTSNGKEAASAEGGRQFVSGSVVQQINELITKAIKATASDIHIEPYEEELRVRFRVDGVLQTMGDLPMRYKEAFISRIKIMAELDIAEKRRPQDGKISFSLNDDEIDIRVSTLPTGFGEKVVLRILDKRELNLNLDSLGFGEGERKIFERSVAAPYGMILVTGPTGSGKTTTLYAALSRLNTEQVNITTIEDPIEYQLKGINQTKVRSDIGVTFSRALRSFLRQDPDIIMVGEIRDRETAEIAMRAALTGHLVLSTLHTNDAPSAITRLLDMGIPPFLVSSCVRMVLAQRLVRKVCEHCESPHKPSQELLARLGKPYISGKEKFVKGTGCDRCNHTGYRGRTGIFELMPVSETIAEEITSGVSTATIRNRAEQEGMQSLRTAGWEKVIMGKTTPEEVLRQTAEIG